MKTISKITFTLLLALSFHNSASAQQAEFLVQIKNHKFNPEIVRVPAGEKFKLIVENLDSTVEEFESHDLRKEKIIAGGKKATIIINSLKAGEYKFVGEFHEKTAQGKIIAE